VRRNAISAIADAPEGYTVTVGPRKRSLDQNDYMWALLEDIAKSRPEGRQWTKDAWKAAFMHYLGHQVQFCEGLEGTGPFPIGFRSSKLNVRQMADLITCILEYGDRHGVRWTSPDRYGFQRAA
jgi:hypothetical protein